MTTSYCEKLALMRAHESGDRTIAAIDGAGREQQAIQLNVTHTHDTLSGVTGAREMSMTTTSGRHAATSSSPSRAFSETQQPVQSEQSDQPVEERFRPAGDEAEALSIR